MEWWFTAVSSFSRCNYTSFLIILHTQSLDKLAALAACGSEATPAKTAPLSAVPLHTPEQGTVNLHLPGRCGSLETRWRYIWLGRWYENAPCRNTDREKVHYISSHLQSCPLTPALRNHGRVERPAHSWWHLCQSNETMRTDSHSETQGMIRRPSLMAIFNDMTVCSISGSVPGNWSHWDILFFKYERKFSYYQWVKIS